MTDQQSALAALRAADPARDMMDTSWPGAPQAQHADQLVDLQPGVAARRTRWVPLVAAAVVIALLCLGVVALVARQHDPAPAHRPTDPHEIAALAHVRSDLANFPVLPGSTVLPDPPQSLRAVHVYPSHERLVSRTKYWRAPGAVTYAARWFRTHAPSRFRNFSSGSEHSDGVLVELDQRYDRGGVYAGRQRVVSVVFAPVDGGVGIRVTAWADWTRS